MPSASRIFNERTKIVNYLVSHFVDEDLDRPNLKKRRIIKHAVDEIFNTHHFPRNPESVIWYRNKIKEILEKMYQTLENVAKETPPQRRSKVRSKNMIA